MGKPKPKIVLKRSGAIKNALKPTLKVTPKQKNIKKKKKSKKQKPVTPPPDNGMFIFGDGYNNTLQYVPEPLDIMAQEVDTSVFSNENVDGGNNESWREVSG